MAVTGVGSVMGCPLGRYGAAPAGACKQRAHHKVGSLHIVSSAARYRKGSARNSLITMALMMSMKKAPTMGTTRNAM